MALALGVRLGPYEVVSPLGAGGMGEVYRAHDTKLNRDVAIKVLPEAVASDRERLARFEREAQVLAALNHPHIAHIHGFEDSTGTPALIMELVEGPTLAVRIAKGPVPIDEALAIARQIAEALEAAHEQGIIHRDLKPANIKVKDDGTVKLLDFGLAKALEPPAAMASANATRSPTITTPAMMTGVGVILGTAAYMSPEQSRGRPVDKRSDVWAFGCVLYEMLTGRRAFDGEDVTETLASIVKDEPDLSTAPPRARRLLRKCLEKDPKRRLRDIGDAWDLLDVDTERPATITAGRHAWIAWSVVGALAVALAAVIVVAPRAAPARRTHMFIPLPDRTAPLFFALSPDGRMVAINWAGQLEIRSLETGDVRTLRAAETPRSPFWSPDGRTVAYFSREERKLKTIPAGAGVSQTLCDNVDLAGTGTWNRDGTIVFSQRGPLMRTSASGGACTELTKPEPGIIRRFPVFLPDGEHFLYAQLGPDEARTGVFVGTLRDPAGVRLLPDLSGTYFASDAPGSTLGRLLFVREQRLMAQAFDASARALHGDATVVADHVATDANGMIAASVDTIGTLMYVRNSQIEHQLAWFDRSGSAAGTVTAIGSTPSALALSPDGHRVAFVRETAGRVALWTRDLDTGQEAAVRNQLTSAAWSPDGRRLAFGTTAPFGIAIKPFNSTAEGPIVRTDRAVAVSDWSRDGRWVLYSDIDPRMNSTIWLLPVPSSSDAVAAVKPIQLVRTTASESQAQLSPDGKWLAYSSLESGRSHVYLRPFTPTGPLPDTKWQVSSVAGREPRWRADSRELYYLESSAIGSMRVRLTAVAVGLRAAPIGSAKPLFEFVAATSIPQANVWIYAPAPDGSRFLVDGAATDVQPTFDVILNWANSERR
jgi:Tol biopolymer transport system component